MEDLPEGVGRDRGQAVWGGPQGLLEQRQRPGGGAVALRGRDPGGFGEDAVPLPLAVSAPPSTGVSRPQRGQAFAVEAADQVADRVAAAPAGGAGGLLVGGAVSDCQEQGGAGHFRGGGGLRSGQLHEGVLLGAGQGPERVFLTARHEASC